MDATLDVLPGEGEVQTMRRTRVRQTCDVCGEPAHYKHTFLMHNARRNPDSAAYGRDDCSWCEDDCRFVCREHQNDRDAPQGMSWCSTFPASEGFAHMFLYWEEERVQG